MKARRPFHNAIVGAILPIVLGSGAALAQGASLDDLFTRLKDADAAGAKRIERQIWTEWSKSGSPSADLLLERGRKAMEAGDMTLAIEHLTALVDHAPDFAEGWNARATAFFRAGEFGPSMADIARVLTLNPRHFGALTGLGTMLEEMERRDQALAAYRAALAIHPHLDAVEQAVERLEAKAAGQEL
ncbi:tetratricopeptide repeat protein [Cereibacter sphaeroides]|uniref:tetratricopeptide repeat protein n=1 Tax=Cereibacter sphaeroides TaxID=1063 RepID=UPI001F3F37C5|nr:tetratricopeptide repeat protein [Cereibacter sphaeroides]MCE6967333.1 tetratricopeptide repeat protein [Cereibacter sphaeroides]